MEAVWVERCKENMRGEKVKRERWRYEECRSVGGVVKTQRPSSKKERKCKSGGTK